MKSGKTFHPVIWDTSMGVYVVVFPEFEAVDLHTATLVARALYATACEVDEDWALEILEWCPTLGECI